MRQIIVGSYCMGSEYIELVFREGKGGEFYALPEHGHIPRIKIGADNDEWETIVSIFLHESMELAFARIKCRYLPTDDFGDDVYGFLFVAQHKDFSDVCGRLAQFIVEGLPDLEMAWKKWKGSKK